MKRQINQDEHIKKNNIEGKVAIFTATNGIIPFERYKEHSPIIACDDVEMTFTFTFTKSIDAITCIVFHWRYSAAQVAACPFTPIGNDLFQCLQVTFFYQNKLEEVGGSWRKNFMCVLMIWSCYKHYLKIYCPIRI